MAVIIKVSAQSKQGLDLVLAPVRFRGLGPTKIYGHTHVCRSGRNIHSWTLFYLDRDKADRAAKLLPGCNVQDVRR